MATKREEVDPLGRSCFAEQLRYLRRLTSLPVSHPFSSDEWYMLKRPRGRMLGVTRSLMELAARVEQEQPSEVRIERYLRQAEQWIEVCPWPKEAKAIERQCLQVESWAERRRTGMSAQLGSGLKNGRKAVIDENAEFLCVGTRRVRLTPFAHHVILYIRDRIAEDGEDGREIHWRDLCDRLQRGGYNRNKLGVSYNPGSTKPSKAFPKRGGIDMLRACFARIAPAGFRYLLD